MDKAKHVAIIDVGKTNAKATLVEAASAAELAHRTVTNHVLDDGPYPHLDVAHVWGFIGDALASLNAEAPIDAIAVTAHGSAGAFLKGDPDTDGLALPILDYECPAPDEEAEAYDAVRPDFSESFSPRLPGGLNLGAQIFWQKRRFADAVESAKVYVNYPQYWAWRLSGVAATEMCSMGAHSDLWNPRTLQWSSLVERMGWESTFAPLRPAFDALGPIRRPLAERLGLKPDVPIICGIHDSSASLLPHLSVRKPPFTVVSTGTWTILFTPGGNLDQLDPQRDTLANVTPFGDPVPCARFMGGREFERLVASAPQEPSQADIAQIIDAHIMALPSFVPDVGPFPKSDGRWTHAPDDLPPGMRTAAASLYLALMTAESMSCAGADGPTIIEGPMTANAAFGSALAAIIERPVFASTSAGGTSLGVLHLVDPKRQSTPPSDMPPFPPLMQAGFADYVRKWREQAGA